MHFFAPITAFLKQNPAIAYAALVGGSFIEILIPFSLFVPGDLFYYPAGILSALGYLNIWYSIAACSAGAIVGDYASFFIGKMYGEPLTALIRRVWFVRSVYEGAEAFIVDHQRWPVLLARFFGPAASVGPFLAATSGMRTRRFLLLDPIAATLSIALNIGVKYAMGLGIVAISSYAPRGAVSLIIPYVIVIVALPFAVQYGRTHQRRRRARANARASMRTEVARYDALRRPTACRSAA